MIVTIIGIGLIGGSLAIDLKNKKIADFIFGVEKNPKNAELALELNLVDKIAEAEYAISRSELVILAIPVDETIILLPKILDTVDNQIVIDLGSTKEPIIDIIKKHPRRQNFVACHPMAGTEFSGPQAAQKELFMNKNLIICNAEKSSKYALEKVYNIFQKIGMRIIHMNAREHDIHAAYVSHISHISSFALALTVLDKEQNERNIFNMAGGGFASTVRLAKSSPKMWTPILMQNKYNILEVLNTYINFLKDFKIAISDNNIEKIYSLISQSNLIKPILEKNKN
jgi:prephenate dehydrogenase